MMDPYDTFRIYQSMKLHFESDSYDAIRYSYRTKVKPQSFQKRNDRYFFAKLAKKFRNENEVARWCAAHFIKGKAWIGDMLKDDGNTWRDWRRRMDSLGYLFKTDMETLRDGGDSFRDAIVAGDGNSHPRIISALLAEQVEIESVVLVDQLTGFMEVAGKTVTETIVWPDLSRKIRKYSPFVEYDLDKARDIVNSVFGLHQNELGYKIPIQPTSCERDLFVN